jgi:predicted outer membrane lipoprotein
LGLNKQLDLQSWFTEVGRDMALRQGWYAQRAKVQLAFITTMAGAGLAGLVLLRWHLGVMWRCYRLTCLGLALLAAFVVIRAASFHHVDAVLHQHWGPLSGNGLLENGALIIIMLGASLALRGRWRRRRSTRGATEKASADAARATTMAGSH